MSSSGSAGENRAGENQGDRSHSATGASGAGAPSGESLLEEVLKRTLLNANAASLSTAGEIAVLRQVAQRYRQRPFDLEPMVVNLVETVLREHYQSLFSTPEAWQAMVREIARTLYEDPLSRERLEGLWKRLLVEAA